MSYRQSPAFRAAVIAAAAQRANLRFRRATLENVSVPVIGFRTRRTVRA